MIKEDHAVIIIGPPGTGKTTTLLNLMDRSLKAKSKPDKIGFISFTKKSVSEAKSRACEKFGFDDKQLTYFRTIHSLAFLQLGLSTTDIMQKRNYDELASSIGVEIEGKSTVDRDFYELCPGDQMVFTESLSRLRCETYRETYDLHNPDFSWLEFERFCKSLKLLKDRYILKDFTDILELYLKQGVAPSLDVLFVDEAQDLCKLQWKVVKKLSQKADAVWIAGDDDQAIFTWSGADTEYFLDLVKHKQHVKVLNQSYRLPKKIFEFSTEIADRIEDRYPKKYFPTDKPGSVNRIISLEEIDFSKGEWLILVRNGYLMKKSIEFLRTEGWSYRSPYDTPKEYECVKAAMEWEKTKRLTSIDIGTARLILSYVEKKTKLYKDRRPDETISTNEFYKESGLDKKKIWHEVLNLIDESDKEYLITIRKKGESLLTEPRIRIATIHSVKGGECENVVLFSDISAKTYKGYVEDPDSETRVFYVAATRAKKSLYIIEPQTKTFFPL